MLQSQPYLFVLFSLLTALFAAGASHESTSGFIVRFLRSAVGSSAGPTRAREIEFATFSIGALTSRLALLSLRLAAQLPPLSSH